jgi:hypothetical protein
MRFGLAYPCDVGRLNASRCGSLIVRVDFTLGWHLRRAPLRGAAMNVDRFFTLPGEPSAIDDEAVFFDLVKPGGLICSKIYHPKLLKSPETP